jgi:hypothetical protein
MASELVEIAAQLEGIDEKSSNDVPVSTFKSEDLDPKTGVLTKEVEIDFKRLRERNEAVKHTSFAEGSKVLGVNKLGEVVVYVQPSPEFLNEFPKSYHPEFREELAANSNLKSDLNREERKKIIRVADQTGLPIASLPSERVRSAPTELLPPLSGLLHSTARAIKGFANGFKTVSRVPVLNR